MVMSRKKVGYSRKQYLINPKFQYEMIGFAIILAFVVIGVLYLSNVFFFNHSLEAARQIGISETDIYFQLIRRQKITMNWIFIVLSVLIYGILFVSGVLLSHRIAGPIFRFCKELQKIPAGEPIKEVKFRPKDYFPELATCYNAVVQSIKKSK